VETNPATRVIILSMYAHNELIFRALQAGAKGYLLKESAGVEVVDAVRSVHADCRYMSRKIADEVIEDYVRLRKDSDQEHPMSRLSSREREVLKLIVEGRTRAEIADALSLSRKTVDTYRGRIMRKLEVDGIPGLVKLALQQGIITLE
jgi:DNA-binding NarL/FixJ family response regulator